METNEKILNKIQKLFKLAESPNMEEALSACDKAHALLKEHNLSIEDIKEKSDLGPFDIEEGHHETKWKAILLNGVAKANYCDVVTTRILGIHKYFRRMYGYEHNVKASMVMYEYLIDAIERLSKEIRKNKKEIKPSHLKEGMAVRIVQRLREKNLSESSSMALVPIMKAVQDKIIEDNKNIKSVGFHSNSSLSSYIGMRAAENISLNSQIGASKNKCALQ